ncbi:HAD family hydrolase [Streptomyces sp. CC77]|uniref:HAD family hydrolase n=1 Tax=Streptomyces sp. CC77 TaxID=1906739 RepID=UPI000A55394E
MGRAVRARPRTLSGPAQTQDPSAPPAVRSQHGHPRRPLGHRRHDLRLRDRRPRRHATPPARRGTRRHVRHRRGGPDPVAGSQLFPDTLPALELLAGDYRHGVLSNSSLHNQDRKLRVLGVRDRFEAVVCAADIGISKPEAAAFHAACDALGLAPYEVAYVGDQPDIDARGATEAGLLGIWLDRAGAGGRPELQRITGLEQLPALLRGDTRFGAQDTFG